MAPLFLFAGLHRLLRQDLPDFPISQGVLDPAIFQRVKADQNHSTARLYTGRQRGEQPIQCSHLIIDGNSQGLKCARRRIERVPLPARPGHAAPYQLGELPGQLPGTGILHLFAFASQ